MTGRSLVIGCLMVVLAGCHDPVCKGCVVVHGVPAITSMALDRDGRIVAAVFKVGQAGVVRMDQFGVLDPGFGERGRAVATSFIEPEAIVIQQSGAIRIGGDPAGDSEPVVLGFTTDGQDDGLQIVERLSGQPAQAAQYLMDQGGALVVSHAHTKFERGLLVRYAENGTQDTSFTPAPVEEAVAMTTDGAFVTAGTTSGVAQPSRFVVRRVTRDGHPDPSFGGGQVVLSEIDQVSSPIRVAARRDGGLVMVGVVGDRTPQVFVARFDGTGTLDPRFGGRGYVTLDLDNTSIVAIIELADGSVMLAGALLSADQRSERALVVRLAPDGSLDGGFADHGRFVVDLDDSAFLSLVVMADGEVVAGGYSATEALLATFPPP